MEKKSAPATKLFVVETDVVCKLCGNHGAVKFYGSYYPQGLGDKVKDNDIVYSKYKNVPHMSHAVGFGGTIPHQCLKCGEVGLIDIDGLEGYSRIFDRIINSEEKGETK